MSRRKIIYSLIAVLLVVSLVLAGVIFYSRSYKLKIIFLDVGQGDAVLIERGNNQVLIDGGPNGQKILEELGKYIPFWDRQIEIVVASHPDADHILGLIDAMENYKIGQVIDNGVNSDSQIYQKYKEVISQKNINYTEGQSGTKIKITSDIELSILSPNGLQDKDNPKDTNISSLVSKLVYGNNSFLFTGDLTTEGEAELIKNVNLSARNIIPQSGIIGGRVLKVAHHGSKYGTSLEFLEAVNPREAIISVGKNNRYGHPAPEVLDRLKEKGIKILRTDEGGDIEYSCNSINKLCVLSF